MVLRDWSGFPEVRYVDQLSSDVRAFPFIVALPQQVCLMFRIAVGDSIQLHAVE